MMTEREWKWVLLTGAAALALASAPYLLGLALQTPERRFGGFVYAVEDGYSYLAKMREGAEGAWLFHIAYTPEPHPGTLFFPFHLLLGKLAALLPGADLTARLVWTYHGARLLFGMGLLLTVYRFLTAFTADLRVRRLAFLLVAFGGGLGWLPMALGRPDWLGSLPLDLILPEGFTFLVLYGFPHIALARTLLLLGLLFILQAWEVETDVPRFSRPALLAGLAWLGMGMIVPFYVLVAWAAAGGIGVALAVRQRRLPWRGLGPTALVGFLSAPVVLYSAWVFTTDPVYAAWSAQNRILSPHPAHYLLAFGLPLLLAAPIAPRVWRERGPMWALLAWVSVVPLLVYLPFNLQRRLVEGVQVPLSLLAARAAVELPRSEGLRRGLMVGMLSMLLPVSLLLVVGNSLALLPRPAPVFREAGEVAALDWLSGRVRPDDVVLATYETGNYLPARVGARAFVGHGPETVRFDEKRELVSRFFDPSTDDEWRRALLAEYGVDWLFWGPAERALGGFDPFTVPYLRRVYWSGGYGVFEVVW